MMKKTLICASLLLFALWSSAVEIRGKFVGYRGETIWAVNGYAKDTLSVQEDGEFIYTFRATKPYTQVTIYNFSNDPMLLWVNDDDRVAFTASKDAAGDLEVNFSGDHAELNCYLTTYMQRNGFHAWPMEKLAAVPFKEHAAAVDRMEKELAALLEQSASKEPKDIIDSLRHDLRSAMLNLKQRYCWAVRAINHEPMDKDSDYVAFNRSLDMNDEAWLEREKGQDITGYPGLIDGRVRWEMAVNNDPRLDTKEYTIAYMEWACKLVENEKVTNYLLNRAMSRYRGGEEKLEETYRTFFNLSTDEVSKEMFRKRYRQMHALTTGVPAPDFEMKDVDGNVYKLSDFRGKALYIDVWATWCGPCCREIPFMEKRYLAHKDNPAIEFLSISMDADAAAWKKKLEDDAPGWKQFIVDNHFKSALAQEYGIQSIPRFLLIDKEGKIITANAPRPSSDALDEYLKDL